MGLLINGVWVEDESQVLSLKLQEFNGMEVFPEPHRYHLYISSACPFSHRVLLALFLKGLESSIGVTILHWDKNRNGWEFKGDYHDDVCGFKYLYEHYTKSDPVFTGRVSVPVLWDKKLNKIVNNQSLQIIEIFNTKFAAMAKNQELLSISDFLCDLVVKNINFCVYRVRASKSKEIYFSEIKKLFDALDYIDELLSKKEYLLGDDPSIPDILLLPTLVRFQKVYFDIFKCDLKKISDYPNIQRYISCFGDLVNKTYDAVYTLKHYSTCFKPCSFSMLELSDSRESLVISPGNSFLNVSTESTQVSASELRFFTSHLETKIHTQDEHQHNIKLDIK